MDGKRQPIIRLFYDEAMGASVGCAKHCVTHLKSFKYEFSNDVETRRHIGILSKNRRHTREEEDFNPSAGEICAYVS